MIDKTRQEIVYTYQSTDCRKYQSIFVMVLEQSEIHDGRMYLVVAFLSALTKVQPPGKLAYGKREFWNRIYIWV